MELLSQEEIETIECNPAKNPKAISIILQEDGNYRGFAEKNGKVVQVRQGDPQTVLTLLITHGG